MPTVLAEYADKMLEKITDNGKIPVIDIHIINYRYPTLNSTGSNFHQIPVIIFILVTMATNYTNLWLCKSMDTSPLSRLSKP